MKDYGGGGLNRGSSYHYKKRLPEGVVFIKMSNKWAVRINKKGKVISVACYDNKTDADDHYSRITHL